MIRTGSALGAALLAILVHGSASARPITLPEAFAAAESSPTLAVAAADIDQARGNLEQARTYVYNPAITASAGPARTSEAVVPGPAAARTLFAFEFGIGQVIELGGKRGARKRAATAERDAAIETRAATRNGLLAEVRRAFTIAVVAQERVAVTTANELAARELQAAATERVRLGAATQTEVNVTVAGLGRAIAAKKAAERDLLLARQALGNALGVVGSDLEPSGAMPTFPTPPTDEDVLVTAAFPARRDLAAAERARDARGADVDLADAIAVPDPELSVSLARDAVDHANVLLAGIRVDLPLWNRNQGNRSAARAGRRRAEIEADALRRTVEREVRSALRRYRSATEAVAAFDQQVVGTLAENLKLARETMAAGKLGLLELNVVRRDLVESQLAYLDSIAEAVQARAALETAIGRPLENTP